MDDLTIYITSNCHKEVVKCFSHNFGVRFSLVVYVYGSDLFMRVFLKTDNRSIPIPGFCRVVFVFFKIMLVVFWFVNSSEFVNCVFVKFKVLQK